MTCCTTLIGDYHTGRTRERYLALQTVCASASATAFFVVGGAVGSAGWRAPFWIYAVGLPLAPVMAAALPNPRPGGTDAADGTDAAPGTGVTDGHDAATGAATAAGVGELPSQVRSFPCGGWPASAC
jgi:MFS family permease